MRPPVAAGDSHAGLPPCVEHPFWALAATITGGPEPRRGVLSVRRPPTQAQVDPGRRATVFEPSPSPTNGDAPQSSSVAVPVSSTVTLNKAASETLPSALPVHHDSAEHRTDLGPQEPSAVSHSALRVARTNRDQVSVVPAAPPLLPSSSQAALPSLPASGLISSRTRRRQAAAAGKPTVDYGFALSHPTPPTARKPRQPRTISPSEDYPRPSIDPVPTMPIRSTTDAVTPAPPLLGTIPPEAPRRASTTAALPEIPSPAEIEFIESVKRCSHSDWAWEQRAEPVRNAAIRYLLLDNPSVLPNDFLLHLAPHKRPPLLEVRSLADQGRVYTDDDGVLLLVRKLTPPLWLGPTSLADVPPALCTTNLRPAAYASVDYASLPS